MRLYSFYRSTATYRVRIALNLKGLSYDIVPIHLIRDGGEQHGSAFLKVNPQGRVPALDLGGGEVLTQSMAILEYLEEVHPSPPLLPADPLLRARIRAVAQTVVADIHPLNNTGVLSALRGQFKLSEPEMDAWYARWVTAGFNAVEQMIEGGGFCFGSAPTFADLCVVPQVFNARRFKVDITAFPKIRAVEAHCLTLAAFAAASPATQPDAEA